MARGAAAHDWAQEDAPRRPAVARHRARAGAGRIIARRDARLTPLGRLSAAASPPAAGLAAAQLQLGRARAAAHDGRCSWRPASRAVASAPQAPAEASTEGPLGQRPCTSSPRTGAGRLCLDSGARAQAGGRRSSRMRRQSHREGMCLSRSSSPRHRHICESAPRPPRGGEERDAVGAPAWRPKVQSNKGGKSSGRRLLSTVRGGSEIET